MNQKKLEEYFYKNVGLFMKKMVQVELSNEPLRNWFLKSIALFIIKMLKTDYFYWSENKTLTLYLFIDKRFK